MEASGGWTFEQTASRAGYVTGPAFAGRRSLRTGIEAGADDAVSHSPALQSVTIPAGVVSADLTGRVWHTTEDASGDRQEILLLDGSRRTLAVLHQTRTADETWQPLRLDLAAYAGKTVTIYVNTFNDGDGLPSAMYLDDLRLVVCTR